MATQAQTVLPRCAAVVSPPRIHPEITPEDIVRVDDLILTEGRGSAKEWADERSFPPDLVKERIKLYEQNLRTRNLTPVQAAIEARRPKLKKTVGQPSRLPRLASR